MKEPQHHFKSALWTVAVSLIAGSFLGSHAKADVKLAGIFGDHMVLQEDTKIPVWGTSDPSEKITVTFGSSSGSTTAAVDGSWRVDLPPVPRNAAAQSLTVAGKNTITLQDVLVGDVWVASGQSNMDFGINNDALATETVAKADEPQIRLFMVTKQLSLQPKNTIAKPLPNALDGKWQVCSPATLGGNWGWNGFSAVAYYFGREIQKAENRPIGLIQSAWGGTQVAGWTSISGLEKNPVMAHYVADHQKRVDNFAQATLDYPKLAKAGKEAFQEWNEQYGIPYQKEMDQWNSDVAKAVAAGHQAPPRPKLAVPKPHGVSPPDGWIYGAGNLFNGMIAPIIPYAIKGVIWFQGENDRGNATEYFTSFPGVIADWREKWNQGDFPWLFVQLANGNPPQPNRPVEGYSVMVRDAQFKTLAKVKNTGMACTIDIGSSLDIHFKDKLDVGKRLALQARSIVYGEKDLVASGPIYDSMTIEGNKVRLTFKDIGSGLVLKVPTWITVEEPSAVAEDSTALKGFAICGDDRRWKWANAVIDGTTVVVSLDSLLNPIAVRYDWQDCPPGNLFNKNGLPTVPFRTDDWNDAHPFTPPKPPAPAPLALGTPAPR